MIKLVKSIHYHYSPDKPVAVTARIIWEIIAETTGFAEESASYTILANLKKREKKDWASTSIFGSFLGKLSKDKEYASVENPAKVEDPDQIFKVFERKAFDKEIHTLADTSDILGFLSGRESPELEWVSWIIKDYNLQSRSKSPEVTRTSIPKVQKRKVPKLVIPSINTGQNPLIIAETILKL